MVEGHNLFNNIYEKKLISAYEELCFQPVFYPAAEGRIFKDMSAFNRPRTLHQQFESYKQEVRRIGVETRRQQTQQKDDAPTCGICRKTKFADGCGHLCSYCQTKFCARCGGRVSLRSNNVRLLTSSSFFLSLHTSSLL
ncbi:hypothetical protein ATANTOWER_001765 [Ataeniobius toweri]|uniref:RIM zinc finger domain-containing protein n=1 Tax=Ataeniobius toweri TaxID=208326 RepID=A0ABU7AE08_9TELE|nr:hypothetical protein [Ataeniobius toweri]